MVIELHIAFACRKDQIAQRIKSTSRMNKLTAFRELGELSLAV